MNADQQLAVMRDWINQAFVIPNACATVDTVTALAAVAAIDSGITDASQLPAAFANSVTMAQAVLMLDLVAAVKNPPDAIVNPMPVSSGT